MTIVYKNIPEIETFIRCNTFCISGKYIILDSNNNKKILLSHIVRVF